MASSSVGQVAPLMAPEKVVINILNMQLEACSISRCRYLVRLFLPSPAAKSKFWAGPGFAIYCFFVC